MARRRRRIQPCGCIRNAGIRAAVAPDPIALRRLTDLAASVDGRLPEETSRQRIATELTRLSTRSFTSQRMSRERRELAGKAATWEAMFAASLEASIVLDKAGVITHVNPAAERLLRVAAPEVIGKPLVDVMLPPTHRSPDNANFASDLAAVAHRAVVRNSLRSEMMGASFRSKSLLPSSRTARDRLHRQRARHIGAPSAACRAGASARDCARCVGQVDTAQRLHARRDLWRSDPSVAARAQRKGLRFRYEDAELQGLALIGNAARLRRVLAT